MKQAIYGKGNTSSSAAQAIKQLACNACPTDFFHFSDSFPDDPLPLLDIEPDVLFPDLIKRIFSALESLTAVRVPLTPLT